MHSFFYQIHFNFCPYYEVYLVKKEVQNKFPNALHNKDKKRSAFGKKKNAKIISLKLLLGKKHNGGFALCQSHYIEKVFLKFKHLRFKEATPYDSSEKGT